jgi:hypothetical protein
MNRNSSETDVYKPYGAYKLSETFSEKRMHDLSGLQKVWLGFSVAWKWKTDGYGRCIISHLLQRKSIAYADTQEFHIENQSEK